MIPKLNLKRKTSSWPSNKGTPIVTLNLLTDTAGSPIYPNLGEIVEHEGIAYEVELVLWNLEHNTIDVCATEVDQTSFTEKEKSSDG